MNGRISSECVECGCQIFYEDTVWVDNSGGDACGDKDSHTPFLDENGDFFDEAARQFNQFEDMGWRMCGIENKF